MQLRVLALTIQGFTLSFWKARTLVGPGRKAEGMLRVARLASIELALSARCSITFDAKVGGSLNWDER